jgi:tetratricopeptide (TPR) repeat protein
VGHTPAGAHPVDYIYRKNPDGSVSCIVGNMDLPSRSRWSVCITVPRDKAFFETQSFWYNPSPLHQSYYAWMNAAISTGDDLQYIFPGCYHIAHNFSAPLRPWPIDKNGRDLSWYKNNDFGSYKSYFTVGEYENFFGGYWHKLGFGFGHWARYDDVPGHKTWIWGQSRQGMIWEDLLTDTDGQYSEPQAGRYLNQNDHALFTPYSADNWKEIWFPYKDTGPMAAASPVGVMNVIWEDNSLTVNVCPLSNIDDDLVVIEEGKEVFREHISLSPMEVLSRELDLSVKPGSYEVRISNRLVYNDDSEANDLHRPLRFHPFIENTTEELFLSANRFEKERNYYLALEKYLKVLEKEPLHTRALCRTSELYFRRGEYRRALDHISKALDNVMYDPEANYIYGIISRRLGNLIDAKETLGWAARSLKFRSTAYCQMAEIFIMGKRYDLAEEYSRRALKYNAYNINAYQALSIALRKAGDTKQASDINNRILELEPLNHLSRYESYLLTQKKQELLRFQSFIRNELPHENYLEMSLYYYSLGLIPEAVRLLEHAPEYPSIMVFPFREESIPVFKWAVSKTPENWKAKYYLALIYWSKGRVREAVKLINDCEEPDFATFYIVRAYFNKENNPEKALSDIQKAAAVNSSDWHNWYRLIEFLNNRKLVDKALYAAQDAVNKFPHNTPIQVENIRALLNGQQYSIAAEILEALVALPSEGATGVHSLFVDCHVKFALQYVEMKDYLKAIVHLKKSQEYPENLGTGKPYDPDFRLQEYIMAYCYDRMEEDARAEQLRKSIYDYTLKMWPDKKEYPYIGGLMLQKYGDSKKARLLLREEKPDQVLSALK